MIRLKVYIALFILMIFATQVKSQATVIRYELIEKGGELLHSWVTAKGSTCSDLAIQSAQDGQSFSEIFRYGGICGSANEELSYSWSHPAPDPGIWYYRIVENGTLYSDTLVLTVFRKSSALQVVPNPISRRGQILLPQDWNAKEVSFSLYSIEGKRLNLQVTTGTDIQLELEDLSSGLYLLTAQKGRETLSTRVFVGSK